MRKREKPRAAGASGKAPLLGERNANMSNLSRVKGPGGDGSSWCLPHVELGLANWRRSLAAMFGSEISKPAVWPIPLNRPGVKRRLEVGLEICAAAGGAIYLQLEFVISRFCDR